MRERYTKGKKGHAEGGRVPFIFGGGAIKVALGRLKDVKKLCPCLSGNFVIFRVQIPWAASRLTGATLPADPI